jgi:hypothetical protein
MLKKTGSDRIVIQLPADELKLVKTTLYQVCIAISSSGFSARMGVNKEEVQSLVFWLEQLLLENNCSSEAISCTTDIELELTSRQLSAIRQAFNEVCNGIQFSDFEKTMGVSKETVRHLFGDVKNIAKEVAIKEESQNKKQETLLTKSNFLVEKEFFLEANEYRISFYLRHLILGGGDIGIFIILYLNNHSSEFSLSCNPRRISELTFRNFILELENHVESLRIESDELVNPLKVSNELFQVQVENKIINSENEEYVDLSFMISLSQRRLSPLSSFVGIKGAILLKNIQNFTSSVQEFLAQLPEETS